MANVLTLQTGESIDNVYVHEGPVTDLQWAPDRTYCITSSKDKTAKVRFLIFTTQAVD